MQRQPNTDGGHVHDTRVLVPEVDVLERELDVGVLEETDDFLEDIPLLSGDPQLITLDRNLDLELGLFDRLHKPPCQIGVDPLTHTDNLPCVTHVRLHGVARQTTNIDLATREFAGQNVIHLIELKLVGRAHRDLTRLELELGVLPLEIEPGIDLPARLVDRVGHFAQIDF